MSLRPGDTLAHYRLVEPIGKGGMGEVWKAADTTLDREVAIKLLPPEFASDADRLARFEREAKVLASLNHPGIAQIYGFHKDAGHLFLAMELVAGEDLAVRLQRGALPVEDALQIGRQVAEALEEAHEHGIVHRDLKPANIVLGADGGAKVLDFGLAKVGPGLSSPSGDLSLSPTVTSLGTQAGVIMGTAGYMSPEQARGKAFDRRTDIWAFGCVLFESLSGRRLFSGETISDTIALILQSQPDWSLLPADTPPRLAELVQRCLDKEPRRRLRDIGDARVELEGLLEGRAWEAGPETAASQGAHTPSRLPLALAGLVVGTALGAAAWGLLAGPGEAVREPTRVSVGIPAGILPSSVSLTPDGRKAVFGAVASDPDPLNPEPPRLYVRDLDQTEVVPIPGTEDVNAWAFSPDSRWLAYAVPVRPGAHQRRLFKVPLDGSAPPLALADWNEGWSNEFLWIDPDRLLVSTGPPVSLRTIQADGSGISEPLPLDVGEDVQVMSLHDRLPGGVHVLGESFTWDERGYHDRIYVVNIDTGAARKIQNEGSNPRWSGTGHLVFSRLETLLAVPMNPDSLEFSGGPVTLADGVRTGAGEYGARFDLSRSGTLIYQTGGRTGSRRRLVRFRDPRDPQPWSDDELSMVGGLTISADGAYLALTVMRPDELLYTVWVSEVDRPRLRQFTAMPGLDCNEPVWLSRSLVVHCEGNSPQAGVYRTPVDRSQAPQLLFRSRGGAGTLRSAHPDGDRILVEVPEEDGKVTFDVPIAASGGPFEGESLIPGDPTATEAEFSPDGRAVAYLSGASGRTDVLVAPYQKGRPLGAPVLAASVPATWLGWEETGEPGTYALTFGQRLRPSQFVPVRTAPLSVGDPAFHVDLTSMRPPLITFERDTDGSFLGVQEDGRTVGDDRLDLVLNFHEELKRLAN